MTIPAFSAAGFLTSLSTLALALFVFVRNRQSRLSKIFVVYSLSIAEWSFFTALHSMTRSETLSFFSARAMHLGVPFIPILFFHFGLDILGLYERYKRMLFAGYVFCILFVSANFTTPLIVPRVVPKLGYHYFMDGGLLYPALIVYFIIFTASGLWLLFKAYVGSVGNRRNQLKYLFWGSVLGYVFGPSCFLPVYNITIFPYPYGSLAIIVYVVMTAYAIFKYRLMDIRVVAIRTVVFAVVYVPVLVLPFVVGAQFRGFLESAFRIHWWVIPVILSNILAPLGIYIYLRLKNRAEEILLREQRRYQASLLQISQGMIDIRELDRLLNLIVHIVSRTVRLKHTSLFLLDKDASSYKLKAARHKLVVSKDFFLMQDDVIVHQLLNNRAPIVLEEIRAHLAGNHHKENGEDLEKIESRMKELNVAVVVPSFIHGILIGFIMLGEKSNGNMYTQDDLDVFSVLANQCALAIENAVFYEEQGKSLAEKFQENKLRFLGNMASTMCHEVNYHFNGITLEAFNILDEIFPTLKKKLNPHVEGANEVLNRMEEQLKLIYHHALGGGRYVDSIRQKARKTITKEPVDLLSALEFAKGLVSYPKKSETDSTRKLPMEEIGLEVQIPADFPKVVTDGFTLERTFANLLSNAYDAQVEKKEAIEKGEIEVKDYVPKVTISATVANGSASVIVRDNGIGMTKDQLDQMFAPFFTTKVKKGTGIGLSSLKNDLEWVGAKISVDSVRNEWTAFTITLPLAKKGEK